MFSIFVYDERSASHCLFAYKQGVACSKKKKKVGVKENVDVPPNYGLLVGWYICDNKMMDYTITKKNEQIKKVNI